MSRANSSMERSELGTRQGKRRQAPAAAEARVVGSRDGARSSSRSTDATSSSSCWTMMEGRGQRPPAYKPPYMDVQTVKTNLTMDQAAVLEDQSHCLLLVEPVLLPDLGHTGVTREMLPGDRPLFYPNGCKNRGLGAMVRNSLYHSASAPRLTADNSKTNSKAFDHREQQPQAPPTPSDWNAFDHRKPQHQQQPPNTPSDWGSRRETLTLVSRGRGSSFLAENHGEMSTSFSDNPAGQGESLSLGFPPDVVENPRVAGVDGGNCKPGTAKTLSRGAADKRVMAKMGRAGQKGGRAAAPKGSLAARVAGATRARHHQQHQQHHQQHQQNQHQQQHQHQQHQKHQQQHQHQRHQRHQHQPHQQHHRQHQYHQPQQHQQQQQQSQSSGSSSSSNSTNILPPADPRHSPGDTNITVTAPNNGRSDSEFGGDLRESDAAGRDSEWVAERRAADAETRELLGALKRNSSRLWFLVGGRV